MFRTVSLSIIRGFSLYTQQWYMSYSFVDVLRAGAFVPAVCQALNATGEFLPKPLHILEVTASVTGLGTIFTNFIVTCLTLLRKFWGSRSRVMKILRDVLCTGSYMM
jgi:hypothetical protein